MTFLFDCKRSLHIEFLEHGVRIMQSLFMETLEKMKCIIKPKRPGMLMHRIIMSHDNFGNIIVLHCTDYLKKKLNSVDPCQPMSFQKYENMKNLKQENIRINLLVNC